MSDIGLLTGDLDSMNETDVREIVVRPLLHRLGYRQGSDANIRTEVVLRYPKAFLGRKKPGKDPDLVGRADYICEVVSFGRWVVEVKSPSEAIDENAVQQAHTYAAHPEVGASFILISNGRRFALFRTGSLDAALLDFGRDELEAKLLPLFNIVGPDAIRKLAGLVRADPGKPLGRGLASRPDIVGGLITYEEHASNTPLVPREMIEGLRLPVVGGRVERSDDGRIHAFVEVAQAAAMFRGLSDTIGAVDDYDFYSADEYVSTDPAQPTIFQNLYEKRTEPGRIAKLAGFPAVPLPFGFDLKAYTQAVGYVEEGVFRSTMQLDYDLRVIGLAPMHRQLLEGRIGRIPERAAFGGKGSFEIKLS